uniref:Uncharacterized protein n=1 Tax=Pseudictyota dubia TaxID=2749911 RepID=A0A7R9YXR6_9STRA
MHGKDVGLEVTTHKYAVLTSCPAGTDESGTHFTPLDTDFFGEDVGAVSWSDYVLIHKAILSLVRASGGFWFNPSTYSSMSTVKEYTPAFYTTLLQCIKTRDAQSAACSDFEVAASMLVEFSLTDEARALAKSYFSFDQVATTQEEGAKAEDEAAPEAPAAATGTSVSASVSNVVLGV